MRTASVLYKKEIAGQILQEDSGNFVFKYSDTWFKDNSKPSISLTLPKTQQEYESSSLFPFFFNMLPEGANKQVVCFQNRIDESDAFGLLLITAENDTIGAVTVVKIKDNT